MRNKKISELFNFNGSVILVTGSSGQIGSNIVEFFLSNNSFVCGLDVNQNPKLKNKNFLFFKGDIKNDKFVNSVIKKIFKKFKKIDVIINNAAKQVFTDFKKRKNKDNLEVIESNLLGAVNIIKNYYNYHKINKEKVCRIINIGSIYGVVSPDFRIYKKRDRYSSEIYGASKAGLLQITKYFSVMMAKDSVIINSISPGGILNKKKQSSGFVKRYIRNVPLGRMGLTDDLLTGIVMFASKYTTYTTGQNLIIDGGLTAK